MVHESFPEDSDPLRAGDQDASPHRAPGLDGHVDPVVMPIPPGRFSPDRLHTLISVATALIMGLFGYEQGVAGGIIIGDQFQSYFDNPSAAMTGFVISIYDLGCLGGAVLALFVGEKLGRKRTIMVSTVIMTSGILLQTAAQSIQHLFWGRVIAGIGNGANTASAPVWHVETSKPEAKGKAVVKEMTVNVFGFVLSNMFTLAFAHASNNSQWRFPLGIQLLVCVAILLLVPILPESPRWLLGKGRESEARLILTQLNEHNIDEEFRAIQKSVREEMAVRVSWAQIFKGGVATRRLLLGMLLQVCQQLTGINAICYYLPYVLTESVGLPEDPARWLAMGTAVIYTMATACSLLLVERLGRRRLLMVLAGAMSLAFIGIAISTEVEQDGEDHLVPGIVATVFITFYFIAFGLGWISIPWLYPAEVNSLSMRTKGAALATGCDWLFNYIVVQTTPIGMQYLKWGLYLFYAALNAMFIPIVYYFVVETSGKSLEQIDEWFAQHPGWRVDLAMKEDPMPFGGSEILHDATVDEERQGLVKSSRGTDGFDDDNDFALGDESDKESDDIDRGFAR